jgi:hypothetical protein
MWGSSKPLCGGLSCAQQELVLHQPEPCSASAACPTQPGPGWILGLIMMSLALEGCEKVSVLHSDKIIPQLILLVKVQDVVTHLLQPEPQLMMNAPHLVDIMMLLLAPYVPVTVSWFFNFPPSSFRTF